MTVDTAGKRTLSDAVAEEIRALLARRRIRQSELARELGHNGQWVSVRLTGKQPLDLNDLAEIAGGLGVDITDLLPGRAPTRQLPTRPFTPLTSRPVPADSRPSGRHDTSRPAGRASNVRRRAIAA